MYTSWAGESYGSRRALQKELGVWRTYTTSAILSGSLGRGHFRAVLESREEI